VPKCRLLYWGIQGEFRPPHHIVCMLRCFLRWQWLDQSSVPLTFWFLSSLIAECFPFSLGTLVQRPSSNSTDVSLVLTTCYLLALCWFWSYSLSNLFFDLLFYALVSLNYLFRIRVLVLLDCQPFYSYSSSAWLVHKRWFPIFFFKYLYSKRLTKVVFQVDSIWRHA
jgi:hypothetical protein